MLSSSCDLHLSYFSTTEYSLSYLDLWLLQLIVVITCLVICSSDLTEKEKIMKLGSCNKLHEVTGCLIIDQFELIYDRAETEFRVLISKLHYKRQSAHRV